ncbi:uncharacterized protein VTP21DRAFT_4399 [Calcarisporiella thermophila]|uniref:uncharacterized protein n=1 Tax=Calcarisporiella thermophila TaxID=911321 RepID=UPI003743B85F
MDTSSTGSVKAARGKASNGKKRQRSGQRGESQAKLFRCTYPNCNMAFTRNEHLARHARKHTGEKPFRCIVPNCSRMFSRFDNMMQHTAIHYRTRPKSISARGQKQKPLSASPPKADPRPEISPKKTRAYSEITLPAPFSSDSSRLPSFSPAARDSAHRPISLTNLPPPSLRRYPPAPLTAPILGNPSPLPSTYPTQAAPNFPPPSFARLRSHSVGSTLFPPPPQTNAWTGKEQFRRLSVAELCNPIEDDEVPSARSNSLTADEIEALQGFSKFRTVSITHDSEMSWAPQHRDQEGKLKGVNVIFDSAWPPSAHISPPLTENARNVRLPFPEMACHM